MEDSVLLGDLRNRMEKSVSTLKSEFGKIRGGNASASLIDDIRVDYYGTPTPVNQMATVSTPEPRQILVTPWDKSSIPLIEKAIQTSDIGLTPTNDGVGIRLNIPSLTEERRKELAKYIRKLSEDTKVATRNIRRDGNETLKNELKEKAITEDDEKRLLKSIQDLTDEFNKNIDGILEGKEKEIMEI